MRRPKKKSPHHRAAFKSCVSAHFHIREQPAYESTSLNKNKKGRKVTRYELQ
jgi:hypothetical protein